MKSLFALGLLTVMLLSGCDSSLEETVSSANPTRSIKAYGHLEATVLARVYVPMGHFTNILQIKSLATEGTRIEKGQPLVSFDKAAIQQQLTQVSNQLAQEQQKIANTKLQTEARLEQLKLNRAQQQAEVEKLEFIVESARISEGAIGARQKELELEIARDEVKRLSRKIEKQQESLVMSVASLERRAASLQRQVDRLKQDLINTDVVAPASGIVTYRLQMQNAKPAVGGRAISGSPVIDITKPHDMTVAAEIPENAVSKVTVGQAVEVVLETVPERVFTGTVASLGNILRKKSKAQPMVILDAEIQLDETDTDLMRPGMSARLRILLADESG